MKQILIETSARHVHLSQEHLEVLFGKGATLTIKKDLSQPGQYLCHERVDLVGPKKTIPGASILGPVRAFTQAEVSLTDARNLGVESPIRESGDIKGSAAIKLVGPCGEVVIEEGLIVAKRHIHMTEDDAKDLNLKDKAVVAVKVESANRSLVFGDVVVRVNNSFALAMHIDTDESNAAALSGLVYGTIVK